MTTDQNDVQNVTDLIKEAVKESLQDFLKSEDLNTLVKNAVKEAIQEITGHTSNDDLSFTSSLNDSIEETLGSLGEGREEIRDLLITIRDNSEISSEILDRLSAISEELALENSADAAQLRENINDILEFFDEDDSDDGEYDGDDDSDDGEYDGDDDEGGDDEDDEGESLLFKKRSLERLSPLLNTLLNEGQIKFFPTIGAKITELKMDLEQAILTFNDEDIHAEILKGNLETISLKLNSLLEILNEKFESAVWWQKYRDSLFSISGNIEPTI